jgi:hypothetical protein
MRTLYYGLLQTAIVWDLLMYSYVFHGPVTNIL